MLLYICSDQRRAKIVEAKSLGIAPIKELCDGVSVRGSGVLVADVGGEELNEAPSSFLAGTRNQRREPAEAGAGKLAAGNWERVKLARVNDGKAVRWPGPSAGS
jgi:hypothetical protein